MLCKSRASSSEAPPLTDTPEDLKQQKFVIEAEPSETVRIYISQLQDTPATNFLQIGEVKSKISSEKGWEPSTQKLIYSGKILQDDKTVESYKIEEKGFIVCMTSKVCLLPQICFSKTGA